MRTHPDKTIPSEKKYYLCYPENLWRSRGASVTVEKVKVEAEKNETAERNKTYCAQLVEFAKDYRIKSKMTPMDRSSDIKDFVISHAKDLVIYILNQLKEERKPEEKSLYPGSEYAYPPFHSPNVHQIYRSHLMHSVTQKFLTLADGDKQIINALLRDIYAACAHVATENQPLNAVKKLVCAGHVAYQESNGAAIKALKTQIENDTQRRIREFIQNPHEAFHQNEKEIQECEGKLEECKREGQDLSKPWTEKKQDQFDQLLDKYDDLKITRSKLLSGIYAERNRRLEECWEKEKAAVIAALPAQVRIDNQHVAFFRQQRAVSASPSGAAARDVDLARLI